MLKSLMRTTVTHPTVVVFLVTFMVLAIHPLPECVECEHSNPWGRDDAAFARGVAIITAWLILASFVAGFSCLRRYWPVPVSIVVADLITQPLGGVPLWSLWSNEGPLIVMFGLAAGATSLLAGHLIRVWVSRLRSERS